MTNKQLSDKLHIVVIDIPKWNKNRQSIEKMTLLDMFIAFFSKSTKYETLKKLAKRNKIMEKLFDAQEEYRQDVVFAAGYRTAEDIERDALSHDNYVKKETIREIVQRLKRMNYDISQIKEISGWSEEDINACHV